MRGLIGYLGGKSKVQEQIIRIFPEHKNFVEVFAGSAVVLLNNPLAKNEVLNDINQDLINLYKVAKEQPQALFEEITMLPHSHDLFDEFLADFRSGKHDTLSDIEKALRFLFLIRTGYGQKLPSKENKSSGTWGTSKFRKKMWHQPLKKSFWKFVERIQDVTIENQNYDYIFDKYDSKDTLFYCDPPYYGLEDYYGKYKFAPNDHIKLMRILSNIKGKFVLSLNDVPETRELYKDFYVLPIELRYGIAKNNPNTLGKELLITNYETKNLFS